MLKTDAVCLISPHLSQPSFVEFRDEALHTALKHRDGILPRPEMLMLTLIYASSYIPEAASYEIKENR